MKQSGNKWIKALISACVMSIVATASRAQSLTWLGTLGGSYSEALGVSADGSVVVGISRDASGKNRAFRWTPTGGMQDIDTLPGDSGAWAVSADGSVVVGAALVDGNWRAFRWTAVGGMQNLGTLGGNFSEAYGVSADGNVVVGVASTGGNWRAFRWAAAGGMHDLGTLLGFSSSEAHSVSADGSVVVGWARSGEQDRAFRWTAAGGMQDLGTLGGNSYAYGVSSDGRAVVGLSLNTAGQLCAFRWTAARGMENLNHTYASLLTSGKRLEVARAISHDGRYIVGRGFNAATGRIEAFLLDTGASTTPSLTWFGTLGGGSSASEAYGVSADGSTVVGNSGFTGEWRAFRWTAAGGMQDLGTLGGSESWAYGVSADGSVVVGVAENAVGEWRAFRWTVAGGMQALSTHSGSSKAYSVSADGNTVVGHASFVGAFRWTAAGGMQALGSLRGYSEAYGVSADGSTVVGGFFFMGEPPDWRLYYRAFRWTAASGMQDLGTLGSDWSLAYGVSADGSVVVGSSPYENEEYYLEGRAFRWTAASGMQSLHMSGIYASTAYATSADGSVVVGSLTYVNYDDGYPDFRVRAFRWTAAGGMKDLNREYANLLADGSILYAARAISPDGRYIVGSGWNAATWRREAFLLDTGFPLRGDVSRDGCIDDADLLRVLFEFGGRGYRNEDINWDGVVDDADLLEVLFNFGTGC